MLVAVATPSRIPAVCAEKPASRKICGSHPNTAYACSDCAPKKTAIAQASEVREVWPAVIGARPLRLGSHVVTEQSEPGERRDERGDSPERQPPPPGAEPPSATGTVSTERERETDRQRRRVDRGDEPDPVREVSLDQRGQQHVRDRHAGQRRDRGEDEQQPGRTTDERSVSITAVSNRAASMTRCMPKRRPNHGAVAPKNGEGQHRQGRHDTGRGRTHAEAVADLVQHRSDADSRRTEVERQRRQPDEQERSADGGARSRCDSSRGSNSWLDPRQTAVSDETWRRSTRSRPCDT